MGYIYKITNQINNKMYIGQTRTPIKVRMYKHYNNAKKANTGIDFAIQKYGKHNFKVEQICECSNQKLDDLEKYYIKYYDTYNNGYNLTTGGQSSTSQLNLNEQEIINKYLENKEVTITSLCKEYNCCDKTISNILHTNNIKIRHKNNIENILHNNKSRFKKGDNVKPVLIVELNKKFSSLTECS